MECDTDTKVYDRDEIREMPRKPRRNTNFPLLVAFGVIVVVIITVLMVVVKRTQRIRPSGTMEASYIHRAPAVAKELTEPVRIIPPPKFKHVIFRLGDTEIFRFTYQDDGDLRYSFEVREGGR